MKKRLLAVLMMLCLVLGLMPTATAEAGTGFYRVSGRQILDGNGQPVIMKGISFGNTNYGNPPDIYNGPINNHDAQSYFELAEMGLDHVRFEFNYGLFEDDNNPYVYKQGGFDWLDQNIEWAKAAGIKLILQMKSAQGGYQAATSVYDENDVMNSGGKFLWVGSNAQSNQARLVALWKAIAERYQDEPTIIGYGLLNEPVAPEQRTAAETTAVWKNLAQRIANAIREVDANHILFVEKLCSWFNADDYGSTNWELLSQPETQFTIDDNNTVYEFHFYDPLAYTHQGASWMSQYENTVMHYPSTVMDNSDWSSKGTSPSSATSSVEDGWVYFETEPFSASPGRYNVVQIQLSAANIPSGQRLWFDDVAVIRTDAQGTETVYTNGFTGNWVDMGKVWSESGLVTANIDSAVGHAGPGALCVTYTGGGNAGPWDNAQLYDTFVMEEGCSYRLGGWVKGTGYNGLIANFMYWPTTLQLDKAYLEECLQTYLAFGETNRVPMHVGEWGFHYNCYDRGAEQYTADLMALFEKYGLCSNVHSYHDPASGLYMGEEWEPRGERNEFLYQLLINYYTDGPIAGPEPDPEPEPDEMAVLPESLTHIDSNTFENSAVQWVIIPDGVQSIGSRAFANCQSLRRVVVPASVTAISSDAFSGSAQVVIATTEGSFAQQFAQDNGIACLIENH